MHFATGLRLSRRRANRYSWVSMQRSIGPSFVNHYFQHYLGENPFGFGGIDIKSYFMGMTGCTWDDTRSSRIPSELKGSSAHTHNALDDAIEQGEMFRRMRERAIGKR